MFYEYSCDHCKVNFLVKKPMSEYLREEHCSCGRKARRKFTPLGIIWGKGMWEFNDIIGEGDNRRRTENGLGDTYIHNF